MLPYDAAGIVRLKDEVDGDLYVSGSGSATLVRALLADGLVAELHLFVHPVVWVPGRTSPPSTADRRP